MEWTPLKSSMISDYRYDPENEQLDIRFTTGKEYAYFNVPPNVVSAFATAKSAGKFFNAYIKDVFLSEEI
jgi:hypothetical protein